MLLRYLTCAGFLLAPIAAAFAADPPKIDFAHDIVPILKAHCAKCHTNGTYKESLSLDTREDLLKSKTVVPGKSGESEFFRRLTTTDPEERMPAEAKPLPPEQIAKLKEWIDAGLPWESGFTFKQSTYRPTVKLRRPELPPIKPGLAHPIDRLVDHYLEAKKVPFPAAADDAVFYRRASLDLVGLMPEPEQLKGFAADSSPAKQAKLIERLLSDRRAYADHWISFWNDLLRNDYRGTGYIDGGRRQISAWLYKSLVDNKPYDQFTRELISPTSESEGFTLGIKWRGNVNASQVREIQFSQNVSQVFFGINMKCASCHDSFIDTWKLDDAYGLAAIYSDKPLEIFRCDKATGRKAEPRFLWNDFGPIDAAQPKAKRLEQLAALVTHQDNARYARTIVNRLWQRLMGRGLVEPVDIMANEPWNDDLLDYLAGYLVDQKYDLQKLISHIANSRTYQAKAAYQAKEDAPGEFVFRGPEVKRLTAEQLLDALYQVTGAGPVNADAKVALAEFAASTPASQRFIRMSLVNADPLMRSLGRPNREQVVTTRGEELTTLQALDLSNGQILAGLLSRGAQQIRSKNPKATADELVQSIYWSMLSRAPSADELTTSIEIIGSTPTPEGLADLLWSLCMLPEFQLIR